MLAYPARQVKKAMKKPTGVAIATDQIALIASMGISGGTSSASAANAGYVSATVNAISIITIASFLFVVFHLRLVLRLGSGCLWREKGERKEFWLPGLLLEHSYPSFIAATCGCSASLKCSLKWSSIQSLRFLCAFFASLSIRLKIPFERFMLTGCFRISVRASYLSGLLIFNNCC